MSRYEEVCRSLAQQPRSWCVTGAAGFIGSHLVTKLLTLNQKVVGLDNFASGKRANLEAIAAAVGPEAYQRFTFIEGDIRSKDDCLRALKGVEILSHQAALGSVPRSVADPVTAVSVNIDGFVQVLSAARESGVRSIVYASSSSVYGDSPELPKVEARLGNVLSPYALTKLVNEQTAQVFARCYGQRSIGLRYFNVFGPRQDPDGPYAAVLPRWKVALARGEAPVIYGDGETSRDFCHVDNAVQANILAAQPRIDSVFSAEKGLARVFNVACGERHSLKQTLELMISFSGKAGLAPRFEPFREGDVRHSLANIEAISTELGFVPSVSLKEGLKAMCATSA